MSIVHFTILSLLSLTVVFGCKDPTSVSSTQVSIQSCLDGVMGTTDRYRQCADLNGLPELDTLRGCFVWKTPQSIGWSTLQYRSGWMIDPSQPSSESLEDNRLIDASFFVTISSVQCDMLLPSSSCSEQNGCLVKLAGGRRSADEYRRIIFRDDTGACMAESRLPARFQMCVDCLLYTSPSPRD